MANTNPAREVALPQYVRGDVLENPDGKLAMIISATETNYAYVTEEGQTGFMKKDVPWLREVSLFTRTPAPQAQLEQPTLGALERTIVDIQLAEHVMQLLDRYGIKVPEEEMPDFEMNLCYEMGKFRGDIRPKTSESSQLEHNAELWGLVETLEKALKEAKAPAEHCARQGYGWQWVCEEIDDALALASKARREGW